jgi:predicted nucleic acid-binding protein
VGAWVEERFELTASPALLEELRDVLARPRFRRWVGLDVAAEFIDGLAQDAVIVADPPAQPGLTPDPDDDYLIVLARAAGAACTSPPDPTAVQGADHYAALARS